MEQGYTDLVLYIDLLAGASTGKVMGNLQPKKLGSISDVPVGWVVWSHGEMLSPEGKGNRGRVGRRGRGEVDKL